MNCAPVRQLRCVSLPPLPMRLFARTLLSAAASIGLATAASFPAGATAPLPYPSYPPPPPSGACPLGTHPDLIISKTLHASRENDSKPHASNRFWVPTGYHYVLRIVSGAWSPYAAGPYWRVSANYAFRQNGILRRQPLLNPQPTHDTPQAARRAVEGRNSEVFFMDHSSDSLPFNLNLYIADFYPQDNRGTETIHVSQCLPNSPYGGYTSGYGGGYGHGSSVGYGGEYGQGGYGGNAGSGYGW